MILMDYYSDDDDDNYYYYYYYYRTDPDADVWFALINTPSAKSTGRNAEKEDQGRKTKATKKRIRESESKKQADVENGNNKTIIRIY